MLTTMEYHNELTSGGPDSQLPRAINESVMQVVSAVMEAAYPLHDGWEHAHLWLRSEQRCSEAGELVSYGLGVELALCPSGRCGAPDDGGVSSWSRWLSGKEVRIVEESAVRSDELMAAAAIRSVMPNAEVERIKEGRTGGADFLVRFPDRSRALVEVTMHTDPGRKRLSTARSLRPNADLNHDWYLWIRDQRFPNDYGPEHSFPLNEVRRIVADTLRRLEQEGADLDRDSDIEQLCEQEIDRQWQWSRGRKLKGTPPLGVTIAMRQPAAASKGRLDLKLSTAINHFSSVIETAAITSATQECISRKLAKDQWGDTSDPKWLVVVLDEGEAATQLRGVQEFEDGDLDFSGITFPGLDEVWVVAFEEGKFTVLRGGSGSPRWQLYRAIDAVTGDGAN